MNFLNYILGEVKNMRIEKTDAIGLIRQYQMRPAQQDVGVLHPLLHRNTSDLSEQRFSAEFSGEEFFLADHVVQGRRILPGVAYLEMARAALVQAGGAEAGSGIRLRNVVWARPVIVGETPFEVHIGLYPEDDGSIGFEIYSGEGDVHSHGVAQALAAAEEWLDLAALRAQCDATTLSGEACYAAFSALGFAYGPAFRTIETIHVGKNQALARLQLQAAAQAPTTDFVLHPSLLDAALQACAGLADPAQSPQRALPFAVDAVDISGACSAQMWALVEPSADVTPDSRVRKYDIKLCDDNGLVVVRLHGFATQSAEALVFAPADTDAASDRLMLLAPLWDVVKPEIQSAPEHDRVLLVGGTATQQAALSAHFAQLRIADFSSASSIADLVEALKRDGEIEHIVWIAPDARSLGVADDGIIEAQQDGVLACFRLVKALLEAGYGGRALEWTLLTSQSYAVRPHEAIHATHAGVHGLAGSLAKEYPNWKVRIADLPEDGTGPLAETLGLPTDAQGDAWAWRAGQWYRQRLLETRVTGEVAVPYRRGGVYVVIGGAGGIGEVWSEHVIRSHAAQVVWIGRRELDAEMAAKIERLATVGPAPVYMAADATDPTALRHAIQQIDARFGAIHGVIHSAIVLRDQSLANMDEARFAASLAAKVDVSVRLAQAFDGKSLDFVLFFSSLLSFSKAAGQSNYAAGCAFKDAFAQQLSRAWPCRVRVMNWGWWGSVGIVASDAYAERMAQLGIASIEPGDGMAALATLLGGPAGQLALLKTTGRAASPTEAVQMFTQHYPSVIASLGQTAGKAIEAVELEGQAEGRIFDAALQAMLGRLLCAQLQSLGLHPNKEGAAAEIAAELGLDGRYGRWLEQTLRVLSAQGYVQYDGRQISTRGMPLIDLAATWAEWDSRKTAWLTSPAFKVQIVLVEAMLRALPEILTSRVPATEVMFPESSMRLVEGIYKHNPIADYFNAVLADVVVGFVEERLRQDPDARVRILEIGAGTGGTSALLFERLRPYAAHIDEYCYTDLSKAFLFHAEKEYGPANPYLRYRLFDCAKPLAEQALTAGSYDLVIAANVLHATRNIRQSVRNAKAALCAHGLLVLNEISHSHIFTHLTFGLLDGWWLYEDAELRIAGCPALSADGWRTVLEDEGFAAVIYPAQDQQALGQQIVVAESDGVVRQSLATPPAARQPIETEIETIRPPIAQAVPVKHQSSVAAPAGETARTQLQSQSPLHDRAVAYFKSLLAKTMKLPIQQISATESLEKYGIDSILVVEMTTALQRVFGNVSSTLFFEYRTLDELAGYFVKARPEELAKALNVTPDAGLTVLPGGDLQSRDPARDAIAQPMSVARMPTAIGRSRRARQHPQHRSPAQLPADVRQLPRAAHRDVAIVGISGRYAQARNVDEFWNNLRQGKNCITEIPAERWDYRLYFDPERGVAGKAYSKWGGFIDGFDHFDPLFFNIAPREAEFMDPQERLFVAEAYASIEDAGHTPATLSATGKVGVFAGVMNSNYGSGTRYWSIANRVSYLFNFQGPSLAVDTACSSSLTALHLALESLHNGACEVAIIGGVNLIIDPSQYVLLSTMNMLSAGDSCRAFGAQADGFVDGEGVGAAVLKPLEQAIADGDQIYGIVKASAINHGGKTNGYTVPNPHGQAAVIARSLREAGIDPRTISYLEAHGTGTSLGDPIEIAGLGKAFGEYTEDRQFCAIGSVKSNIGHCESAAGIAGITKVLMQLKHGQLAPSLHVETLNPHIDFSVTPFAVQGELAEWKRPVLEVDGLAVEIPRRAGISSFGAGGSNAHVVIEEYIPASGQAASRPVTLDEPALVVLSAKNAERLRERVERLVAAIDARGLTDADLPDLAYTLQVGREAMDERLALSVGSMSDLATKLAAYLAGDDSLDGVFHGQAKRSREEIAVFAADEELREAVAKWIERKKFDRVLSLWAKGLDFDWRTLYGERKPRRISLPTYPFARERYWLNRAAQQPAVVNQSAPLATANSARTQVPERLNLLAPVWQAAQPAAQVSAAGSGVLIVGGTSLQREILQRQYHQAQVADFAAGAGIGEIADTLAVHDAFDHLIWIAPEAVALDVTDDGLIDAQHDGVLHGFRLIKGLLAAGYGTKALEWSVLTTQTQAVDRDEAIAPAHAGIHGLIGTLAKEYPNWRIRLVDLPLDEPWPFAEVLALPVDRQGNSWAWRHGQWYRQQLLPATVAASSQAAYRQGGVYVVIGGAGGIGEAWSEHVARDYGAQTIWIGRRPLDAEIQARIDRVARVGAAPHYIAADAGQRAALEHAYAEIKARFGSIHGVIHSALVLGDQALANMDEARFVASLASKVDVSVRLAQVFGTEPLDFVLFFSSLQSFARGAGQSNYAAGCLFKDAFAQRLGRQWPCAVKVMNWGWWGSVGVAVTPAYQAKMKQLGLASIEAEEGWAALAQLLGSSYAQLALVKTSASLPTKPDRAGAVRTATSAVASNATLDDERLHELGIAAFSRLVGGLLLVPLEQLDPTESLAAYGIDSISVNQLCGLLGGIFVDVNHALFFDYQTIDELVGYFLATQRDALAAWVTVDLTDSSDTAAIADTASPMPAENLAFPAALDAPPAVYPQQASDATVPLPASAQASVATQEHDIAIIGMAGRFPEADSVDAYWQMLLSGRRADNRGPARRWPEQHADGETSASGWGMFLDHVDHFDPGFFGIPPLHADAIDPQERLFLMSCWHALEDAGYGNDKWLAERSRAGDDVGVFVGVTSASYNLVGFEQSLAGNPQVTGLSFASIANRVSHALGLTGPSLSLDTMCSASLVALHTACESLRREECAMAIAGGVNLNLHPSRLDVMAQARITCDDGESRSFGAGGKGFLAGEGVGAVVLKSLAAAQRDGDTIHAVIKGSAVGHSGATLNYFAPSSRGQSRVIAKALERAGLTPAEIDYVEMQCSGDEATDAAEFDAIKLAYQIRQRVGEPLRLGSVKPNVGHAEAAAGMAQLIKTVMQLKHRTFVKTLTRDVMNPQMNFADMNLVIQRDVEMFPDMADGREQLRIAINAVGAGGTAAHVIVESGMPSASEHSADGAAQLFVLSARSHNALRHSAEALAAHLERNATLSTSPADIAYTLQVGRREFHHRLAIVSESIDQAAKLLRAWLAGHADVCDDGVFASPPEGVTRAAGQRPAPVAAGTDDLFELARRWSGGMSIDWREQFAHQGRRGRVSLPAYPFELRSCWPDCSAVPALMSEPDDSVPRQAGALTPLASASPAAVSAANAEPDTGAALGQAVETLPDAASYIDAQIKSIEDHLHLATVGILYDVMQTRGVVFEERHDADGRFALYLRPPGIDGEATARLLERLLATQANGSDPLPGSLFERAGGRAMSLATRLLERFPGRAEKTLDGLLKRLPGADGLTAAYLLKLLEKTPFIVSDEAGTRLALPATIRSRRQLDELRSQYEISLRALPEYQSYCELLAAIVSGILDGQRPGHEHVTAASALLVDMFTAPSKLAFINRLATEWCVAERFVGQATISVLAIGAGGFEFLAPIVEAASSDTHIEYNIASGWSQIAMGVAELGRERFPGVSFASFVPMLPGALIERLGESRFDVVIVNMQDPCAQEAITLLDKLPVDTRGSLVFVTEPIDTRGLALILDLTDMWPSVAAHPGVGDVRALGEVLTRAGYQGQVVVDSALTIFSRDATFVDADAGPSDAQLAEIRDTLLTIFNGALDDGSVIDTQRSLADAGIPSMTWALIFAKLQRRFGKTIEPGLFTEAGPEASIESLSRLLAGKLHSSDAPRPRPPIPDTLGKRVIQHLADVGRTEIEFVHTARLSAGEFTSSRGQVFEYFEHGTGPALIFLSALAFSKSIWEDQIREFGDNYRLIFPHLPGHGGSVYTGTAFTFDDLADDLVELMDELDIAEAHLVGWCIAGNIAQLIALRHPKRLKSLALVCTTPTDARMRGVTQKDLSDYSVSPLLTYQMEFNNIYHENFLAAEVTRSLAIIRQAHVPVESQALMSFIGSLFEFDTRDRLHEIKVPTLVVAGTHDIAFPIDQVALLKDGIRHAHFVVLEKGGHLPFLNQSGLFNDALKTFLADLGKGGRRVSTPEFVEAQ